MPVRPHLRLALLGSFRLEHSGERNQPLHLPRRKVASLLAYLALYPQPHRRDHLAMLFWPEAPGPQAHQSLRTALSVLRTALDDAIVLADRLTVQLAPDYPLWIDVREFERERDVALYHGDLLVEYDDDWIALERERLRALYIDALLANVRAARARSDYAQAIALAQRVLAAEPAHEQAHQHLIFCYMALGDRTAALRQYEACERALRADLDAPPLAETVALLPWIRQAPAARMALAAQITNLPVALASFVGRKREMIEVKQRLAPPTHAARAAAAPDASPGVRTRLLTITGAGGSGKTRLALQAATDLIDTYPDGIWWVELAGLGEPALLPHAIANALGVREATDQPIIGTLVAFLRARRLLLALDNCEHLVSACAHLVAELLGRCPQLQILATSREPLGVSGEVIWPLSPLPAPNPKQAAGDLFQFDSVRLFVERARAVKPSFALTPHNAGTVAEICWRLEGLPLALELAAARVPVLALEQMAARLDDLARLLAGGSRSAPPRQQTLWATLDWSHDLLALAEQRLFRRLSVFAGGFSLAAAEAVGDIGGDLGVDEPPVLELLAQLVQKSLVVTEEQVTEEQATEDRTEEMGYRLLEPVRQYGWARLQQAGELAATRWRHAQFYLDLAEATEPKLLGPAQFAWLERLDRAHDNLRAALGWCQEAIIEAGAAETGLRLAGALGLYWMFRSHLSEGQRWLDLFLAEREGMDDSSARVKALAAVGWLSQTVSDYPAARTQFAGAIALGRAVDNGWDTAYALIGFGLIHNLQSEFAAACTLIEEGLVRFRQLGDAWGTGLALTFLVWPTKFQGHEAEALRRAEAAVALQRQLGNPWGLAQAVMVLGTVYANRPLRDDARAIAAFAESLPLFRQLGDTLSVVVVLQGQAEIALHQGNLPRAAALGEESLALNRQVGSKWGMQNSLMILAAVALRQSDLERAAKHLTEGLGYARDLGDKIGVAVALDGLIALAVAQHQMERAVRLAGATDALRKMIGSAYGDIDLQGPLALAQQSLGEAAYAAAWAAGRALPWEEAVAYALAEF